MSKKQQKDLEKHHHRIDDQGNSLVQGTILWLIIEAMENCHRIEAEVGATVDRPSKKRIKAILNDLRDQLIELKGRID